MYALPTADAFDLRALIAASRGTAEDGSRLLAALTDEDAADDPLAGIDDLLDLA